MTDDERHAKRLNRIAYANIGLGLMTFFVWAIRGPGLIPIFWQYIDHDLHPQSDPVGAMMASVLKVAVVLVVVGFWFLSGLSLMNGILILERRRHRLCMVLSGISLLGTPFHLIIGILSLVTLNNDWAKMFFAKPRRL